MTKLGVKVNFFYWLNFSILVGMMLSIRMVSAQELPPSVDPGRIDQDLRPPTPSQPLDRIEVPDIPDAIACICI